MTTHTTTITGARLSPLETLRVQEALRMRVFVWLVIAMSLAVAATLPFIDRPPLAERVALLGIAGGAPFALWFAWQLRTPEGYTPARALAFGFVCLLAAQTGIYLFGVLSPACAALALGIYLIAPGQERTPAWLLYAATALSHAALTFAVMLGAVPDLSMVQSSRVPVGQQLVVLALAQTVLLIAFLIGRTTQKTMLSAIEQHGRAQRAIVQRTELLREAREELDRALHAGRMGRFTDETVGAYELGAVIGSGGMGEVYDAVHTETGARAAVKVLYPHAAADRTQVERFLREARIATALDSENVCRVSEIGTTGSGVPFMAMERLDGEDLADVLRKDNQLQLSEVVELVGQIASGLEAARIAGVVHRDIKPRNLFVTTTAEGRRVWKILDFGVSKIAESSGTLTQNQIVGTPRYMAPEQASGKGVDHRADQFALAIVAYRAITGRPAFMGESMPEILYQVLKSTPPAPSTIADVPAAVDRVLARAMNKDPEQRFATPLELASALARAAGTPSARRQ